MGGMGKAGGREDVSEGTPRLKSETEAGGGGGGEQGKNTTTK